MSRKPSDTFTRFTATAPHASRPAPSPTSSTAKITTPDTNETAAQRVARLRAAHRNQRDNFKLSAIDKLIYRGRIWADITHRIAAYTLIGFTGIAACVASYGIFSLITHNRRQKRAWIEREMGRLHDAQTAFLAGNATPEQLHLLEQERAGDEMVARAVAEKARKKEDGIFGKAKAFIGGQAATGDRGREEVEVAESRPHRQGGERILEEEWVTSEVPPQKQFSRNESERAVATGVQGVGLDSKGRPVPMDRAVKEYQQRQATQDSSRTSQQDVPVQTSARGGPLDVMAGNIVGTVTSNGSGGWLSWLRGSRS